MIEGFKLLEVGGVEAFTPLAEISEDTLALERETEGLLGEITKGSLA